jgi:hypothetical protein
MAVPSLRVFIGWDEREPEAYDVARFSLQRRASPELLVEPIKLADLRARGLYWRNDDPLASTDFTYSRFLTPFLAGFSGWALFCDCDFLWLSDVNELMRYEDSSKAVLCVQHDYRPKETTKMDGKAQSAYPRKNWSSLMLFNCNHPALRVLTPEVVNSETGAYLHRMEWVSNDLIGSLPIEWNWLEGWNERPLVGTPKAVHFTRGGPWFEKWQTVEYSELWLAELQALHSGQR